MFFFFSGLLYMFWGYDYCGVVIIHLMQDRGNDEGRKISLFGLYVSSVNWYFIIQLVCFIIELVIIELVFRHFTNVFITEMVRFIIELVCFCSQMVQLSVSFADTYRYFC